jgi:hypothetical protein
MYNSQLKQEITPLKSWDQKLDHFVNISPLLKETAEHYTAIGVSLIARIKVILASEWKHKNSIKSRTVLLRADRVHLNTDKDYGLSKVGLLYQEQGVPHFIVRCPLFNGCGYCGYCTAVLALIFISCFYCGSCTALLAQYFSRC